MRLLIFTINSREPAPTKSVFVGGGGFMRLLIFTINSCEPAPTKSVDRNVVTTLMVAII